MALPIIAKQILQLMSMLPFSWNVCVVRRFPPDSILFDPVLFQPYVIMKDLQSGAEYLWSRSKFINRKFVMQEMYQDYEDGDDWQLPDEKDPFTESPDAESLIGCVEVSMQSLGYVVSTTFGLFSSMSWYLLSGHFSHVSGNLAKISTY